MAEGMKVHELHPAVIHLPLITLPAAAMVDLIAAVSGERALEPVGTALWWTGSLGGLFAGLAGAAASQEVQTPNRESEDRMFLHGVGNLAVLTGAFGIAAWRSFRRPSVIQACTGIA